MACAIFVVKVYLCAEHGVHGAAHSARRRQGTTEAALRDGGVAVQVADAAGAAARQRPCSCLRNKYTHGFQL